MFERKLSNEDQLEIKQMLLDFKTYRQIADIKGVSTERIRQIAKKFGLQGYRLRERRSDKEKRIEARLNKLYGSFYKDRKITEIERVQACKEKFRNKKNIVVHSIGGEWEIEFADLDWVTHCPVTGDELNYFSHKRIEQSPSFDRINPNLGYVKGNVKIISWRANRIKNDGTAEEHEKIAKYIKESSS